MLMRSLVVVACTFGVLGHVRADNNEHDEHIRPAPVDDPLDLLQCNRRCQLEYGRKSEIGLALASDFGSGLITGIRKWSAEKGDKCQCFNHTSHHDGGVVDVDRRIKIDGLIDRADLYQNPETVDPSTHRVCGADGKTYESQELACAAQTYPLHGGACGRCSNAHDIQVYNITKQNMTTISTVCFSQYTFHGQAAVTQCMNRMAGLTPGCTECWVENIGCDAAQCVGQCLFSIITRQPLNNPDGSLNACLECDEMRCGTPFIVCAGANRRRSGIVSDIDRASDQIWKRTAC